jgi:hypothetical protein
MAMLKVPRQEGKKGSKARLKWSPEAQESFEKI